MAYLKNPELLFCLGLMTCLITAGGCDSQLGDAFKSFNEFSTGKAPDPYGNQAAKVSWKQRRWQDKSKDGRSRAIADIEIRADINKPDLEKLLRDACHHNDLQRSASVLKVRAWPGRLESLAAPLGIAVFARDGHGWDGKGVGFEKIQIFLLDKKEPPRPSIGEHALAENVEIRMSTGEAIPDAIRSAAKRMTGNEADLKRAVTRVQTYYDAVRKLIPQAELKR